MHRFILLIVVVVAFLLVNRLHLFKRAQFETGRTPSSAPVPQARKLWPKRTGAASRFHCDGRVYCSQMTSRAEAVYFSRQCPGTKMDGDHDGIPCENDSRF